MRGVFVGIDVGGTHTDGVAVEEGRVVHKVKVPTHADLRECTLDALEALLDGINPRSVRRVVLSTTLVTNAVAQGDLEPTGTLITAGPGISPRLLALDDRFRVVPGAIDHRGREIVPLGEAEAQHCLEEFARAGIRVLAVAGKFSTRNPSHERRLAELAGDRFEFVALGHQVAGTLNFPRRIATAYLAAGAWRLHRTFVASMTDALRRFSVLAPLYLLRADGGTHVARTLANPAETALSGPAASALGALALDAVEADTVGLDVGGTTTDLCLFTAGSPLLEPHGATIGPYRTQIRALFTRSAPAGGDSWVRVEDGRIRIGPRRFGPPAALGGTHPTPTDALVVLGRAVGNRGRALEALAPIAQALGTSSEGAARRILRAWGGEIAGAVERMLEEVNARPVYTLHELLEGHRVRPHRVLAVGGPARALAPYVEEALDLPVTVPNHFDVANAVGAAVARVNAEVHAIADTARRYLSLPEAGVYEPIPAGFTMADLQARATETLLAAARARGELDPAAAVDVTDVESFNVIEGFTTVGRIHRLRAQIRPGILFRVE
ncbi:hydantoinase/oxoprolinase family protein [Deferrisoma sp.]